MGKNGQFPAINRTWYFKSPAGRRRSMTYGDRKRTNAQLLSGWLDLDDYTML